MKIIEIENKPFYNITFNSSGSRSKTKTLILPFYKVIVDELPEGITSFVATSDLQGREKSWKKRLVGELVAEELEILEDLKEIPKINFILLAGDLYDYPECHKLGGTGDVTRVWNAFAQKFPYVIGVHGNHDIVEDEKLLPNISILDGNSINKYDINIGGVSGIIGKVNKNQRKSEEDFYKALTKVTKKRNDIIILHQGPNDEENKQKGDPLIREHLEKNGSGLLIFGHCHWSKPFINIGKNQVLNVDCQLYLFTTK